MPSIDSVYDARRVIRSGQKRFRIIRTVEVDEYERSAVAVTLRRAISGRKRPSLGAVTAALKKKPTGDKFGGTSRKKAKISISGAPLRTYKDLKNLMAALKSDDAMANRQPKIKTGATSGRVTEEEKNVKVKAFLYAASRENDNDFHLIIGRAPSKTPEMYMTMEISGLPPDNSPDLATLTTARDAYKNFFGSDLPGFTYDFYDPPVPVTIAGSLFFDASHATGTRPGPQSLKSRMPTVWEVHPVTSIKLG